MSTKDLAKLSVITSIREKLDGMQTFTNRAEVDDEMTSLEYLANIADMLTSPTVRILATLYSITKLSEGEEKANALVGGYIEHLFNEVTGLTAKMDPMVDALVETNTAISKAAASSNRH